MPAPVLASSFLEVARPAQPAKNAPSTEAAVEGAGGVSFRDHLERKKAPAKPKAEAAERAEPKPATKAAKAAKATKAAKARVAKGEVEQPEDAGAAESQTDVTDVTDAATTDDQAVAADETAGEVENDADGEEAKAPQANAVNAVVVAPQVAVHAADSAATDDGDASVPKPFARTADVKAVNTGAEAGEAEVADGEGAAKDPATRGAAQKVPGKAVADEKAVNPVRRGGAMADALADPVAETPKQAKASAAKPNAEAAVANGGDPGTAATPTSVDAAAPATIDDAAAATPSLNAAVPPPGMSTGHPSTPAIQAPAAPPTPPEARFAEVNHPNIVNDVRTVMLPRGGGSMQIRLDPPELGALQVSVEMRNGTLSATFQTSNDDATRLLSHSLGQLKTALESQGVNVDRIQVQQSPKDQASHNQDGQQQQKNDQAQQEAQREQQRREMLRRMWRRVSGAPEPMDLMA